MTAFAASTDLPSNINTTEKLAAWVGLALARCNPTLKILENPQLAAERVAQVFLIRADDGSNRLIVRLSLPVIDGYAEDPKKFWEKINALSDTALPAAFKAN